MADALQRIGAYKNKLEKALQEKNKINDVLAQIEARSGINRLYLVLGAILTCLYLLATGFVAQFLCNLIGFVYPAYCSIKAIESTDRGAATQWLTYWVVYSCFQLVETLTDRLLSWVPLYWLCKCCVLVWCFADVSWNGSTVIYERVIRPLMLRHQDGIDATVHAAKDRVDCALDQARRAGMEASGAARRRASDDVMRTASVSRED